jgi:hypothetical protein
LSGHSPGLASGGGAAQNRAFALSAVSRAGSQSSMGRSRETNIAFLIWDICPSGLSQRPSYSRGTIGAAGCRCPRCRIRSEVHQFASRAVAIIVTLR